MTHREPGQGWTTVVPAGWRTVSGGPAFWRGNPWDDPVRLVVEAHPGRPPAEALAALAAARGLRVAGPRPAHGRWRRHAGDAGEGAALAAELAVAEHDDGAVVAALVAPPAEMAALVDAVMLPALDALVTGPPDPPRSLLATPVPEPAYWPTDGWRAATPESQGMDGARLGAMLARIRGRDLPVDSVTVVRHGHVVLDAAFGAFAAGTLGATYATGRLHKLQSVTKTVVGMLLGIALAEGPAGVTLDTPFLDIAGDPPSAPRRPDPRMRAITLRHLLTMRSGLAWRESGHAYERGGANDVMAMILTRDWTRYVLDRPVAVDPGTRFTYDSGAAHLVSAAISRLTGRPAHAFAAERLFRPLGIARAPWLCAPEGVASGGFGLLLDPLDVAKLAFLALHRGRWEGREVVPAGWLEASTTDHVRRPPHQYGHLWWLDRADGYAHMAGLHGQLAVVHPGADLVVVMTGHFPAEVDATAVERWLLEEYVLPAAG